MRIPKLIVILNLCLCNIYSQEYIAKLNQNYDSCLYTINSKPLGYIYKNDTFLTYKTEENITLWPVWTKDGNYGYIPKEVILLLSNTTNFKLITKVENLKESACSETTRIDFEYFGLNYCELIQSIIEKNYDSLNYFFCIAYQLEGALASIHSAHTWQILNYYTDEEFYSYLLSQNIDDQIRISRYITTPSTTSPITKIEEYFTQFYPLTWTIVAKYGCIQ